MHNQSIELWKDAKAQNKILLTKCDKKATWAHKTEVKLSNMDMVK